MVEFYANGIMSHPFTFKLGGGEAAKIGVADLTPRADGLAADGALPVSAVKAWEMTLTADQESLEGRQPNSGSSL